MRLIVTRPLAQGTEWVARLGALGLDAAPLPLIAIAALDDDQPLRAAWQAVAQNNLVMFVSANAVEHFFAAALPPTLDRAWPAGVLAGATGPGTSAALRRAGVPAAQIVEPAADAPAFDSEALWLQLRDRPWAGRRVLLVRGDGGRDWLADTLRAEGALVDAVTAYRRQAPLLDAAGRALLAAALQRPAAHLWLFSSSEALGHLQQIAAGADWRASRALASHPRIAAVARAAGFGTVDMVATPTPQAVAAWLARRPSIESAPL